MGNVDRKIKRFFKTLVGKDFFPRIDCRCKKERLGSKYCGWEVAVEKIKKDSVIYSFGVGEDASFDIELINQFGVVVHAFDPTPGSINWVQAQNFSEHFVFHKYGLADFDGELLFNPPRDHKSISYTILERPSKNKKAIALPVKKLETIMKELRHGEIAILKMDIEGAEYQVIDSMAASAIRPGQVLVEFHHRFPGVGLKKTKDAIKKLRKMGYGLFSVSSSGEEFCFMLKSIV
ncbi:MAG TPA: FkbM family methyltransferase [Thermodesulfobacteriota bacterium]|nr:FkbM family methyltransferase [Thermodesulfobacteriota bacterium]